MESLQAEIDALAARCAEQEQQVADLTAQLAAANARIAELESIAESPISILDGRESGLARDGSDPRVLSVILAATAVVAGTVALLAFVNDNLDTTFGYAMVVTALGLAYASHRTRLRASEITVSNGVVYIKKGETSYRFDLRQASTSIDMVGQPGDPSWQVYFHRKGMDDFVVDARMVNADEFVRRLREHRPDL
ncbi:hypothetical protein [Nocardioides bizhenqiangii]|uniref:Uncharacterized protein n=1 Tax=Nocardioides bizhenqiangii TaxID=3095076 RepID=A0ABZ0ZNV1_9ACTN|nr:hypothetical protein [Nocardioides sp. HM61]WQQ26008.1 hypothetical protein SHK19_18815 [Nocardioides sp. HM61]